MVIVVVEEMIEKVYYWVDEEGSTDISCMNNDHEHKYLYGKFKTEDAAIAALEVFVKSVGNHWRASVDYELKFKYRKLRT